MDQAPAPYSNAIDLILNLLRGTAELNDVEAVKGSYQKDLQGKTFTLLQVFVDPKTEYDSEDLCEPLSTFCSLLRRQFRQRSDRGNSRGDAFPPRFMQYVVKTGNKKLNARLAGVNVNTQTRIRTALSAASAAA